MKRSQLVQLIREELEKYPAHKNIEANLMKVLNREKPELKMSNKLPKDVVITYTSAGRFYSVKVDGEKLPGSDAAKEFIKIHTGLELPNINSEVVDEIIDALKAKGIDARESEMDI